MDKFQEFYAIATGKLRLKLWTTEFAKGYLSCCLNNMIEVDDDTYNDYAKMIDDLGEIWR